MPNDPLARFPFKTVQYFAALIAGCTAIYLGVENGYIISIWCLFASYGATLGVTRLFDWRASVRARRHQAALRGEKSPYLPGRLLGTRGVDDI